MRLAHRGFALLSALLALLLVAGCATAPQPVAERPSLLYLPAADGSLQSRHAPLFLVEASDQAYNRIGTPRVDTDSEGRERVWVDPATPAIYVEQRRFETARGRYTNLLYRIHFERVPFSLFPFYIGMGRNVGLFVIVTLDREDRPLLYTTVHSCGCYVAFVPTSFLPADALPAGWPAGRQSVYLEDLPAMLDYGGRAPSELKPVVLIRSGSHRVRDLWLMDRPAPSQYEMIKARLLPLDALEALPMPGASSRSFYEEAGPQRDYVKNNFKPWERLFMSWWALDWRIGEDKRLGRDKGDGPLFYTSLKPWARRASDLRDFPGFLAYWGWRL